MKFILKKCLVLLADSGGASIQLNHYGALWTGARAFRFRALLFTSINTFLTQRYSACVMNKFHRVLSSMVDAPISKILVTSLLFARHGVDVTHSRKLWQSDGLGGHGDGSSVLRAIDETRG